MTGAVSEAERALDEELLAVDLDETDIAFRIAHLEPRAGRNAPGMPRRIGCRQFRRVRCRQFRHVETSARATVVRNLDRPGGPDGGITSRGRVDEARLVMRGHPAMSGPSGHVEAVGGAAVDVDHLRGDVGVLGVGAQGDPARLAQSIHRVARPVDPHRDRSRRRLRAMPCNGGARPGPHEAVASTRAAMTALSWKSADRVGLTRHTHGDGPGASRTQDQHQRRRCATGEEAPGVQERRGESGDDLVLRSARSRRWRTALRAGRPRRDRPPPPQTGG